MGKTFEAVVANPPFSANWSADSSFLDDDRFSKYADKRIAENKTTEAKADSDQRKLAGWTANSKEIGRYTKRTRDNRAMMVGLELQEKHSSEVSKIVGQYDEDLPF